jgi:hypothetical protein
VRSYSIGTNAGIFTVGGQVALLKRTRLPLAAGAGAFTVSGQAAGSFIGKSMTAAAGSFVLTGQPAGMTRTGLLSAAATVFSLTGQPANIGPPDPSFSSVSLLMHMDGADGSAVFTDSSSNRFAVTRYGSAQITTAQSKFGGASGLFNGTSDYLSVPDSAAFAFGAGAFTIEAWVRFGATTGTHTIAAQYATATANYGWSYYWSNANNGPTFAYSTAGTSATASAKIFAITANTWYHFALTRSSNMLYFFVDGASLGTANITSGALFDSTAPVLIGAGASSAPYRFMNGNIDDLRITKGVARYTAAFTPPTRPFSDL